MLRLREQGLSLSAIGRRLGVTRQAVASMLDRLEGAGHEPRYPGRRCPLSSLSP
jgi:DNA-binding MarR family transcriptional regulator